MLQFQFKAMTVTGEHETGVVSASSAEQATHALVRKGLIPISTVVSAGSPAVHVTANSAPSRAAKPLSTSQLQRFTQQLATVLDTGSTLERALGMVERSSEDPAVRALSSALSQKLRGGETFSDALEADPTSFSKVYVAMVRAGEASGQLPSSLFSLARDLDQLSELKKSLIGSLIYPGILFCVSALSLAALLGFVVPRFEAMFADAGVALPKATQIVIAMAHVVKTAWPGPLILFLMIWLLHKLWGHRDAVQQFRDKLFLSLPLVGTILHRYAAARLCRVLGSLSAAGVPLHQAFVWSSDTISNTHLHSRLGEAAHDLRAGLGLSQPLKERSILPPMAMEMIEMGEEAGALSDMLAQAATTLDADVAARLKRLVTFAEPLIIVVLGVSIGAIVMSIFAAVISLNDLTV